MASTLTSVVLRRNNVTVTGDPSGRPMVFAHGFGCSQAAWNLVAPQFETDHRVVLFDHVGAGGSDLSAYSRSKYDSLHGYADDVLEILEALDLHDVVFVGHSVSAMIGVLASIGDPSRFGALILVGPSPRYVNDGEYLGGFDRSDITVLLDDLDANYLGWSAVVAPMMMGNRERPELGVSLTESFCRTDPEIARHFADVTFLSDNRADLALVTVPALVVQSSQDAIAPNQVGEFVHRAIAGSSFVRLSTSGHIPNLSGPDELIATIRTYLT